MSSQSSKDKGFTSPWDETFQNIKQTFTHHLKAAFLLAGMVETGSRIIGLETERNSS